MLDSPPPYSPTPGPHEPSPSIWTRVFRPLGVAIAAFIDGDFQLDVAVPVEDLRPKPTYAQITSAAAYDIRFCQMLFDEWMTKLDNVSSDKPDERERVLRFYLRQLTEDAGWCSNAINKILRLHVRFASLMAQWIDDASKSESMCNLKYDVSETTRIANDISKASRSLSIFVSRMKDNLKSFVSALEEVQVAVKEQSLAEKFLGWLKYLLKAIVSIVAALVAAVCSPISSLLSRVEPNPQYLASAISTLGKAAALFLKKIVPREVTNAEEKLKEFDEALYIMGLESHMMPGGWLALYGPNLGAVAKEWRDQVKQYQSMLPGDEDPAC